MAKNKKLGMLGKWAKRIVLGILRKRLKDGRLRGKLVTFLNNKIDIPRMTEAEERRMLDSVVSALEGALVAVLDD